MAVYGVLGDIHGNREALTAVIDALEAHGVTRLLCVGDIVGYNADPDECATLLRERDAAAISGTHDLIGTHHLGFDRCSNKAMHALEQTRRSLHPETARYLETLPARLPIEERVLLIHGGVRNVEQYMTKPRHIEENVRFLRSDYPGRNVCFFGHTHEQKVFEVEGETVREIPALGAVILREDREYFLNAGSVDASRKRGEPKRAEFAIFDSAALIVEFFRISYNDALTESKAAAAGYRLNKWADRLYEVRRRIVGPRQVDSEAA
jgi:predicted phosphodiesterase